jgi:small ubiquitin-related modifier
VAEEGGREVLLHRLYASSSCAESNVIITLHYIYLHHSTFTATIDRKSGEETFFKVKKHTKMSKIFNAYASRKGVDASSLRFLLDGENVEPDSTPKMLELEDQDQIDAVLEQVGGRY